ncbi:MAG: YihA family ribosome biogenesis GTP-binding protein [Betaproteobacteria bacterium]|nr:YihA family ribosome biogenesis GTP-binding protein [Betaproteobacteria bacterium]
MNLFSGAVFTRAAARPRDLPPPGSPEVAFAGRSNVGKSSAINAVCGRRALARTSKTPGRTQTINWFELPGGACLVDLPGYGFARASQSVRERWRILVSAYLERSSVAGLVLVMDARHPLMPLDRQLIEWLGATRLLVLLSKADKLSRMEQGRTLAGVEESLSGRRGATTILLFSSVSQQGVEQCRDLLAGWLMAPAADRGNKKPPVKGM